VSICDPVGPATASKLLHGYRAHPQSCSRALLSQTKGMKQHRGTNHEIHDQIGISGI
jgi:hypothetical protein